MNVGGFSLAENAGPARDRQMVDIVGTNGPFPFVWVRVPLPDNNGFFEVASDYLAIGNGADWCRVPMGGAAAQLLADKLGCVLPTAFMVDLIWRAGTVKLGPTPFRDLTGMMTTRRFVEHNAIIEQQRQGRQGLVVGQKKDVIISNRLENNPSAVCIYGWHEPNGKPIQPISTAHHQWWYSDYSHGIRLVKRSMVLADQAVDIEDVWRNPRIAHVLTGGQQYAATNRQDDAILRVTRYNTKLLSSDDKPIKQAALVPTPSEDLGLRALRWCQQEIAAGVKEEPSGSNAGQRIAEYFKPARRRATGQLLGIERGDWCAVAQSAALAAAARPNEPGPHGYRAAVWELEEDAHESKAWVPASDIRAGKYTIRPGDLVLWTRGQAGSRLGHVSRVETPPDSTGSMTTLGGNENNAWTRRTRNVGEAEFRGVIKYRDFLPVDFGQRMVPTTNLVANIQSPPKAGLTTTTVERILTDEGWLRFEEDYLPRVVTGENGRAHPEALKAQAVAARTYVLRAMRDDLQLGRTKPIANSQKFQVFAKTALPSCIAAVDATRGMVGKYEGALIIANFVAGAIWENGKPGRDPTNTEKWVTYNEGKTGNSVTPTRLSSVQRKDNRGCMSQNGADALARAGRTFNDILRFFYGADLQIAATNPPRTAERIPVNTQPTRITTRSLQSNPVAALAMSTRAGKAWQLERPQIAVVTGSDDEVQAIIDVVDKEMTDLAARVTSYFGETDSLRKQWDAYRWSWQLFYYKNYLNTPLRDADALQRANAYRDQVKDWNYAIDVRVNQGHATVEGVADRKFPVLPLLGAMAVLGMLMAFGGGRIIR